LEAQQIFLHFNDTISREEHKIIYSGSMFTGIDLVQCPIKVNYRHFSASRFKNQLPHFSQPNNFER
jgi:hypothetical protein